MSHHPILTASVAVLVMGAFAGAARAGDAGPARAPAPVYDWSGSYFGLKFGYGDGDVRGGRDVDGFIGGIQGGYNLQFDQLVVGYDSDTSLSEIDSGGIDIESLSTNRLRLGYAVDRVLPYITGGLAHGEVDAGSSEYHFGYALGAGLEYAFADGWSARLEYTYVDLESRSHRVGGTKQSINPEDTHLIRAGISMKTGWIWDRLFGGN